MKIGIVTFWQSKDNYGQILQCWALQQFLKSQGHDPFLIRYDFAGRISCFNKKRYLKIFLVYPILVKFWVMITKRNDKKLQRYNQLKNRERRFGDFFSANVVVSEQGYNSYSDLKNRPPVADCYITGSDQVWAQLLSIEDNRSFFLSFGGSNIKRVAYAPSFAMKEYPQKLLPQLKQVLSAFDAVSVREFDGCRICESVGIEATKVLDPTLLLDNSDYLRLLDNLALRSEQYVYIYSLNISSSDEIRWGELQPILKDKGYSIIVTPASGYIPGRELFSDVEYSYSTIQGWLSNICNAELVVTTSFHGIVFCILLETPFAYVPLQGKYSGGNNRVFDLLDDLRLNSRILHDYSNYESIINESIDWKAIKSALKSKRADSVSFLKQALS